MPGAGLSPALSTPPLPTPSAPLPVGCAIPLVTRIATRCRWLIPRRPTASPRLTQKRALNSTPTCGGGGLASQIPGGRGCAGRGGVPLEAGVRRAPGKKRAERAELLAAFLARVLRVSSWHTCLQFVTKGSKAAPSAQGFSLPLSSLKPIHDSLFRRIISELGLC